MTWLQIVRLAALGFSVFCGILVLGLGAHLTSLSLKYFNAYDNFEALGIAVGLITLLTVPVMLLVDFFRTGAFTSMVIVELAWLSFLWILWLATGALTADTVKNAFDTCNFGFDVLDQACNETRALEAFSFLAWLDLFAYTITLLVVALLNSSRGAPMWRSSVKEHPSIVPAPSASSAAFSNVPAPQPHPQMGAVAPGPQTYPPAQYAAPQQQAYGAGPQSPGYAAAPHASPAPSGAYSGSGAAPSTQHSGYPQV